MFIRIIFSKYLLYTSCAVALIALRLENSWLRIAIFTWFGLIVLIQLIFTISVMLKVRKAYKNFPDTTEYKEYSRDQEQKQELNNKNKISL